MHESEKIAEITAIVARLREVQDVRKLTDAQLLREYPDLGSTRTWRQRFLAGNMADLNLDRQLMKLRRIAVILDGGTPDEIYFHEMGFAREMRARLGKLETQTNDRRILVCLAPNGVGKSAFARWAVAQSRATRCYVRIRPTWRNKAIHICRGVAKALGKELSATNPAEAEDAVIAELSGSPRTVFLDQAHEGGLGLMNELRAFVDETPSRFVYLAYPTAYNRVRTGTTDALIEAQAFLGRCLKPPFDLYRNGVASEDVSFYLRTVAGLSVAAANAVTTRILPELQANTNLRLLDDAIESASRRSEDRHIDPELIVGEVTKLAAVSGKQLAQAHARTNGEEVGI